MGMRVAVVQATPVHLNPAATLDLVAERVAEASREGARLVLFPEAFIPGYPRGLDFETPVGDRGPGGRQQWLEYAQASVPFPGPESARLGQIAATYSLYLCIGLVERAASGTLYCSLCSWNPAGVLIHKHRKLKPTAAERIIWGEGDGSSLTAWDTPEGRVGGLICWENYMPEARMALYRQHIGLYLAPTADQRERWQASMLHIACESRSMVLAANQYVPASSYPPAWRHALARLPDPVSRGGSVIISPLGEVLAGPLWDQEGILYAEWRAEDVLAARMDFNPVGHYGRPDVFS